MSFIDRNEAGERLATALAGYRGTDAVVLALPRGGVEVGLPVARALGLPLDLLLVRKIGVPFQPEVAMGAIVDGDKPEVVRNEDVIRYAGVSDKDFDAACRKQLEEIERRRGIYLKGREPVPVGGRTAIIVDDGVATGATLKAALKGLAAKNPRHIVVAMPVIPASLIPELEELAEKVICLEDLGPIGAVGAHYRYFPQLEDADVVACLDAAAKPTVAKPAEEGPPPA
ncbi:MULTISPECIES: phosphoribosyltransferase [Ciceribacter]|uniref:Putative phosphoribosyltransferase n=1 Tax=Ciceribacter lividus TaxID=1197950 RepID=A0A6I7HQK3_9HYPH|nr:MULTISPECIES: phosphoribosyltransferase family protein [Ciceribacter]MCO6177142.1 phosphoribosyltransferase [Ciceribacter sp. RN22]RCW27321.1 putative phosphoribosyltransferase [Ciceribacter lividus]